MKKQKMWAVAYPHGFYCGTWLTRQDAKNAHCEAFGRSWEYCLAKGDYVARILITELKPKAKRKKKK